MWTLLPAIGVVCSGCAATSAAGLGADLPLVREAPLRPGHDVESHLHDPPVLRQALMGDLQDRLIGWDAEGVRLLGGGGAHLDLFSQPDLRVPGIRESALAPAGAGVLLLQLRARICYIGGEP